MWRPTREIWTPQLGAKNLRYEPTTGNLAFGSSGNLLEQDCCCYIQAKKCSDDSDADIWFLKSAITLPYYFKSGGICYYVLSSNNQSSTPGTLAGAVTYAGVCATCLSPPISCSFCNSGTTPANASVTIAGWTVFNCCNRNSGGNYYVGVGTINGTFDMAVGDKVTSCEWQKQFSNSITSKAYSGTPCTGTPALTQNLTGPTINVKFSSGHVTLQAFVSGTGNEFYDDLAITTPTDCFTTRNFTNDLTTCTNVATTNAGIVGAGGTATVVFS